jgi:hypothetical protein
MRSKTDASTLILTTAANPPSWTATYQDCANTRTIVHGSGLLVCHADLTVFLSSAPAYNIFIRWLIDGIAPGTTDYHSYQSAANVSMQGQPFNVPVRAAKRVPPGVHSVVLQARTDSAGTNNTLYLVGGYTAEVK